MTAQIPDSFRFRNKRFRLIGMDGERRHFNIPKRFGVTAEMDSTANYWGGYCTYYNLNLVVPFTGIIRLAKDFIQDLYVHMGFQKASAFETVYDITLLKGEVLKVKDHSEDAAAIRGQFKQRYDSREHEMSAVIDAFGLDQDFE